jgi:hypothetical protein
MNAMNLDPDDDEISHADWQIVIDGLAEDRRRFRAAYAALAFVEEIAGYGRAEIELRAKEIQEKAECIVKQN